MAYRGIIWAFARGAAWAAAYAFVLNAMLATSLLAATPVVPGDVVVLCVAHPDGAAADSANGAAKRAAGCCKLCLPGLSAALPPPAAPDVFTRTAVAEPQQLAFVARFKAYARLVPYSSRAPPASI